jgi:hypothetical protein
VCGSVTVCGAYHRAGGFRIEAIFDDLLDWNDWFLRKRLKPPLNMVALGTFNDQNHQASTQPTHSRPPRRPQCLIGIVWSRRHPHSSVALLACAPNQ